MIADIAYRFNPHLRLGELGPAGDLTSGAASLAYFGALFYGSLYTFQPLALGGVPFWDPGSPYHQFQDAWHVQPGASKINLVCTDDDLTDRAWDRCWECPDPPAAPKPNVAILAAWPPFRSKDKRDLFARRFPYVIIPHEGMLAPLRRLGVHLNASNVCPPEPAALTRWLAPIVENA